MRANWENARRDRWRNWWPYWFLIDAIGMVGGVGGSLAYIYVSHNQIPIWKAWDNLWPNLTSSILVVWFALRVIDRLLRRHETRRWRPTRDFALASAAELVAGCLRIFDSNDEEVDLSHVYQIESFSIWGLPDLKSFGAATMQELLLKEGHLTPVQEDERKIASFKEVAEESKHTLGLISAIAEPDLTSAVAEFASSIRTGLSAFSARNAEMRFIVFSNLAKTLPALAKLIAENATKMTEEEYYLKTLGAVPQNLAAMRQRIADLRRSAASTQARITTRRIRQIRCRFRRAIYAARRQDFATRSWIAQHRAPTTCGGRESQ